MKSVQYNTQVFGTRKKDARKHRAVSNMYALGAALNYNNAQNYTFPESIAVYRAFIKNMTHFSALMNVTYICFYESFLIDHLYTCPFYLCS